MTDLPAAGYFSDPTRTNLQAKQAQDDTLAVIRELLGGDVHQAVALAADTFTPTKAVVVVDTEAGAAADNLANINQTNMPDGRALILRSTDAARDITVKHGAGGNGQILLADAVDYLLDDPSQWLLLRRNGTNWEEVLRSYGKSKNAQRVSSGFPSIAAADAGKGMKVAAGGAGFDLTGVLGDVITKNVGDAVGNVPELQDLGGGVAALPPVNGSKLSGLPAIVGAAVGLTRSTSGNSVNIQAARLIVEDDNGNTILLKNVNVNIDYSVVGPNGLDTGARAASTEYHDWVIYNPTTKSAAGLASLSSGTPTMPAGFTAAARIGGNFTDQFNNVIQVVQTQKHVRYSNGQRQVAGGSATWPTTVSVASVVPSTARKVKFQLTANNNDVSLAPNGNYGQAGYMRVNAIPNQTTWTVDIVLDAGSTTVVWSDSSVGGVLNVVGWEEP